MPTFDLNECFNFEEEPSLSKVYSLMGWERARKRFKASLRFNLDNQDYMSFLWDSFIHAYGNEFLKGIYIDTLESLDRLVPSNITSREAFGRAVMLEDSVKKDITKLLKQLIGKNIGMRGEIRNWSIEYVVPFTADVLCEYIYSHFTIERTEEELMLGGIPPTFNRDRTDSFDDLLTLLDGMDENGDFEPEPHPQPQSESDTETAIHNHYNEDWRAIKEARMRYVTDEEEFDCPPADCYEIPTLASAYYCRAEAVIQENEVLYHAVCVA
jgi:hypothetical protein